MKKILLLICFILVFQCNALAINDFTGAKPFCNDKNLWGLQDASGNTLIEPAYNKFIHIGDSSFLVQKRGKFGLIDYNNNELVPIKYSHAERILGQYLKIGNGTKYGLYNDKGDELLKIEYSTIDLLFGGMFLTEKDYKYGVIDSNGRIVLENKFDDIYMPKPNIMRIKYEGRWYEIEQVQAETLTLPENVREVVNNQSYIVSELAEHPVSAAGYSVVTFTDYLLKVFSSISPAHEKTIDTLMLSQGADAVNIYLKFGWLAKYPVVFVKNYYNTLKNPHNGPLSEVKSDLRKKMQ